MSLNIVPMGLINNFAANIWIMAWCRPGSKPLSEPMMVRIATHMCVTRPQWVNEMHAREVGASTNFWLIQRLNSMEMWWRCVGMRNDSLRGRAPSQYPKRRLFVRSRKVTKPRDWYFKLSYRFEIWQAHRQQCCRSACQISERSDNSKYKSRGFDNLQDLTERRLFGYWDGAQVSSLISVNMESSHDNVQRHRQDRHREKLRRCF